MVNPARFETGEEPPPKHEASKCPRCGAWSCFARCPQCGAHKVSLVDRIDETPPPGER
jgi:hypothetical protein